MKDIDEDTLLGRHLSGDPPREALKEQVLRDSMAALVRARRRRSAWRRAELAAAAILIAGVTFFGGRLSVPRALPENVAVAPDVATVPMELVEWLNAARLFRQLGMEDRMARAVERAGRLLPVETVMADARTLPVFAAAGSMEDREEHVETPRVLAPSPSVQSLDRILAQAFGD